MQSFKKKNKLCYIQRSNIIILWIYGNINKTSEYSGKVHQQTYWCGVEEKRADVDVATKTASGIFIKVVTAEDQAEIFYFVHGSSMRRSKDFNRKYTKKLQYK